MFKVKPFKEIAALSKEKLDKAMAPIRSRAAKAKANLKEAEIDEKLIQMETKIHELCAEKDLNLDKIINLMDEYELLERKKKQVNNLIGELFPEE